MNGDVSAMETFFRQIAKSQLEDLLKYASSLGMAIKGMNEL